MWTQVIASVFCLIITLLVAPVTARLGEESKSYPVLSGVGVALRAENGRILVGAVVPNSPADECGKIEKDDCLLSVKINGEQTPLNHTTIGEATSLIRGPVGTELTLVVLRPRDGTRTRVTLKREPLELDGVAASTYKSFVGKPVRDLQLSSLDGATKKNLSEFRGKVIVLDFWASWCPTCYAPVAKLQSIAAEHPEWADEVELITVTVDADVSDAANTIRKQEWNKTQNFAVGFDDLKAIGVRVVPVAIVISKRGKVVNMAGSHALDFEKEIMSQLALSE